jgi:DNA (cytosine-5)-methyltransferase 1
LGYEVGAADLCASGVGAPHIRQRIFWMAHAENVGRKRSNGASRLRHTSQQFKRQGIARGLADSNGGQLRDGGLQSGRQHGQQPEDGGAGRLADLRGTRLEKRGIATDTREREAAVGSGDTVGLGNADSRGLFQHVQRNGHEAFVAGPFGADAYGSGADQRVEHTQGDGRLERRPESGRGLSVGGFWDSFDLVLCTDNKARRIEPESFPLAHGVPGRVGLLRGYGNAIVPELAAQFIKASTEAIA